MIKIDFSGATNIEALIEAKFNDAHKFAISRGKPQKVVGIFNCKSMRFIKNTYHLSPKTRASKGQGYFYCCYVVKP